MTLSEPRRDPEGKEHRFLHPYIQQSGGRVLDIGCGDGRLTWLIAPNAELTVGTDIDMDDLRNASSVRPGSVSSQVCFAAASGEAVPFVNDSFNLAIFSWSL